jgi:hypothetical protein
VRCALEAKGRRLLCVLLIRLSLMSTHSGGEFVLCDALKHSVFLKKLFAGRLGVDEMMVQVEKAESVLSGGLAVEKPDRPKLQPSMHWILASKQLCPTPFKHVAERAVDQNGDAEASTQHHSGNGERRRQRQHRSRGNALTDGAAPG